MSLFSTSWRGFNRSLDKLAPLGDFTVRLWLFTVFFISGYNKFLNWDTTVIVFQYEYHVPLFSPYWAALLATSIELFIPILILLGLGGRLPAFILFIFNLVAVISYPFLWTDAGWVGLKDHIHWGLLIMLIMFHGTGRWSMDYVYRLWRHR